MNKGIVLEALEKIWSSSSMGSRVDCVLDRSESLGFWGFGILKWEELFYVLKYINKSKITKLNLPLI